MRALSLIAIATLCFVSACKEVGTSTGNPADGSEPSVNHGGSSHMGGEGGGYCPAEPRVLAGLDADTGLGFTAADILAFAGGTHRETLRWNEQEFYEYGPEHGEHELTITVEHDGGEVRVMEPSEGGSASGEEPAIDIGFADRCMPWLEIDVRVTLRSDGGALDESWDATLRAQIALLAEAVVVKKADELMGAFEVTEVSLEGFTLAQVDVRMSFTPLGNSGSFSGTLEMRSDDAVSAAAGRGGPFADWGRAGCEHGGFAVALDEVVMNASGQAVLDAAAEVAGVAVTWDDTGETTAALGFTPEGDGACVVLEDSFSGEVSWLVAGELRLTSEDGRLDARWPGLLWGTPGEQGGFSRVEFELDTTGALPAVTPENLATVYGLNGIDASGYDALSLSIELVLSDMAGAVTGELRLIGLTFADCAQPGPSEPMGSSGGTAGAGGASGDPASTPPGSSGGGSAGCQGAEPTDLLIGIIQRL